MKGLGHDGPVTASASDANAAVAYFDGDMSLRDADPDTEGFQVDLASGANDVGVRVTAQGGIATQTYTITATKNPALSALETSEGTLAPAFSPTAELEDGAQASVLPLTISVGSGTATAGSDFTAVTPFTLSIPANTASHTETFTLTPSQDDLDEPDETVTIGTTATLAGVTITGTTLTISDDDPTPQVILTLGSSAIDEVDDPDTIDVEEHKTTVAASLSHRSSEVTTITIDPVENVISTDGTITIAAGELSSETLASVSAIDNQTGLFGPVLVTASAENALGVVDAEPVALIINDNDGPDPGTPRLVGGATEHEGRLEVFFNGTWGTVCDDYWDQNDAMVACRALGYPAGSDGSVLRNAFFGEGTGNIHIDNVACRGDEANLLLCPRHEGSGLGTHNCSHKEDVSVRCVPNRPTITAAPGLSEAPGADGQWGAGETLRVTLTFNEPVNVVTGDGTPYLEVRFGDSLRRRASYVEGSGGTEIVFSYTLGADEGAHAGAHASGDTPGAEGFDETEARPAPFDAGHERGSFPGFPGPEPASMTTREALADASFAFTAGTDEGGLGSLWAGTAMSSFGGGEDDLTLDGEVTSAMLGADWSRERVMAGLILGHSFGEGGYRASSRSGSVTSTLTGLYPWGRYALTERIEAWGVAGYGAGTLTLESEGTDAARAGLDLRLVAAGLRGIVVDSGIDGLVLTAKTDAMALATSTDGLPGSFAASEAEVTRLRLALEGSRPVRLGESAVVTPSLELGVRHDGGDAETGFGADIGVGVALSDPARGLSGELRARGLLTHQAGGFDEHGLSGTLAFEPSSGAAKGLSVNLTQTMGGPTWGGAEALFGRTTLAGLGAQDGGGLDTRHLDVRIGYGFSVFDKGYMSIPELGLGLSNAGRQLRLGWRLAERASTGLAFELGVEGTRRESAGATGAEHGIAVRAGWRLVGEGTESFELRLEAARRDAANDDAPPEHSIGVRLDARW